MLSLKWLLSFCLFCLSSGIYAQVKVITPNHIQQYGLNFSIPESEPYTLLTGSQYWIDLGYDVSIGSLYLRDNRADRFELISKTLQGNPAVVKGKADLFVNNHSAYMDASENFETIIYVSENPSIVSGDSGNDEDVFIYNRTTDQTVRVEANQAHQGTIGQLRISPNAKHLSFTSTDKAFSNTSIPGIEMADNAIYIYDLSTQALSFAPASLTLPNYYFRFSLPRDYYGNGFDKDADTFSPDGRYMFFYHFFESAPVYFVYDISTGQSTEFDNSSESGAGFVKALTNDLYVYSVGHISILEDVDFLETLRLYDLTENKTYPIQGDGLYGAPFYGQNVLVRLSANKRYAILFSGIYSRANDHTNFEAGRLWVLDTQTKETRPTFTIQKTARTHIVDYLGLTTWVCDVPYVLNADFFQAAYLPCTSDITLDQYINGFYDSLTDLSHRNVDSYNVFPKNIKFHNDARYITFDANSWYIDDSIDYGDFPTKPNFLGNPEPDYKRDSFVVVNPFLTDLNLVGEPSVDRSSETGVYIWQHMDGRTFVQVVAGGSAQGGESTLFNGSINASSSLINLIPYSIEASDVLNLSGSSQIDFNLYAISPWEDRFSFVADNDGSICINLTDYAGGLFIGPNKVAVSPPYDIGLLKSCNEYAIPVEGRPDITGVENKGWFIWQQNGQWRSEIKSGFDSFAFQGGVNSTSALTNVIPVSIESDDVLAHSGNAISFDLNVIYRWYDGFRFNGDSNAEICVSLSDSTNANIYLGPDKVPMPKSFELNTLTACDSAPQIETLGRPPINRSLDHGVFVWENSAGNWQVEVASGDTPRWIDIELSAEQTLTGVQAINIESNDSFNVSSSMIDARFRVRAPWYDGFRFTAAAQSISCLTTGAAQIPIYVGPGRVNLGSSVNLDTLESCQ